MSILSFNHFSKLSEIITIIHLRDGENETQVKQVDCKLLRRDSNPGPSNFKVYIQWYLKFRNFYCFLPFPHH